MFKHRTSAAQHAACDHMMITAAELKWVPSAALPAGAQIAVIRGPAADHYPEKLTLRHRFR